jgi:hypothetical protein
VLAVQLVRGLVVENGSVAGVQERGRARRARVLRWHRRRPSVASSLGFVQQAERQSGA